MSRLAKRDMADKNPDTYTLEYLERQVHNLGKLVEINGIINSTLDIGKLLTIIMEIIKDIMDTETSSMLLYEESTRDLVFRVALGEAGRELQERYRVTIGQGIAGWVAENRKGLIINDAYNDPRFDPNFDRKTGFKTRAILCVPLLFKGKLLGVIQAINPLKKDGFDEDDQRVFITFANQAVLAVQNAIFFQKALEEERIMNELASARSIQSSLHPALTRRFGALSAASRYLPAREVGGEFFDISQSGASLRITLGDIHTKGIPGAIQASVVNGAVQAFSRASGANPTRLMKLADGFVAEELAGVDQVSLFYGVIDLKSLVLQFANAGYAYPLLVRDGAARYIRYGTKPLGVAGEEARRVSIALRSGDAFVVMTDGVISLNNRRGQQLGLKRVMDFFSRDFSGAEDILDSLLRFADEFTEGLEKREDISIVALVVD